MADIKHSKANTDVAGWGVSHLLLISLHALYLLAKLQVVVSLLVTATLSVILSILCSIFLVLEYFKRVKPDGNPERAYRAVSSFLMDLSVNQLVMGFALFVTNMRIYGPSSDPHAILAIRLSNLSAVSQIQIVLVAYHPSLAKVHIRLLSSLSYGFAAAVWGIIGNFETNPIDWRAIRFYSAVVSVL